MPDSRPSFSGGASVGIMALVKTMANSAPMVASAKATSAMATASGSPGTANHSAAEPATSSTENAAIQGLRRPEASAMAPSAGEASAMMRPAAPAAKPHSAWPSAGVAAIREAKNGANTKVVTSVKNGCEATSNMTQPTRAEAGG